MSIKMTETDCSCFKCVCACHAMPGGLLPSDVDPMANFLGLTRKELFKNFLVIDYWTDDPKDRKKNRNYIVRPNRSFRGNPNFPNGIPVQPSGSVTSNFWTFCDFPCIFLENGKCTINEVKPWNCRTVFGCAPERDPYPGPSVNNYLADAWRGIDIVKFMEKKSCGKAVTRPEKKLFGQAGRGGCGVAFEI